MAIFRKNRNKKNTSPAAPAAEAVQPAVPAAQDSDGFTPVLAFGTEPAPAPEQKKPKKQDDITGEVDSIAGIFGKSKSTASASRTTEEVSAKMSEAFLPRSWIFR